MSLPLSTSRPELDDGRGDRVIVHDGDAGAGLEPEGVTGLNADPPAGLAPVPDLDDSVGEERGHRGKASGADRVVQRAERSGDELAAWPALPLDGVARQIGARLAQLGGCRRIQQPLDVNGARHDSRAPRWSSVGGRPGRLELNTASGRPIDTDIADDRRRRPGPAWLRRHLDEHVRDLDVLVLERRHRANSAPGPFRIQPDRRADLQDEHRAKGAQHTHPRKGTFNHKITR
jgi:hypothetical protein